MDYDKTTMPASYDAARAYNPGVLETWMALLARELGARRVERVVDLGSGTGRYSGALRAAFGSAVVAIDPSAKMHAEARRKAQAGVARVRARGEALPVRSGSIDLVFMSMVFHHFEDAARAAAECRRVLRPGGLAFLRAGTVDRIARYPFVPFIPESIPLMHARLPRVAHVRAVFEGAGLSARADGILEQEIAASWAEYVARCAARADSILVSLDDAAYAAGMARLAAHAAQAPADEAVIEPIDWFAFEG